MISTTRAHLYIQMSTFNGYHFQMQEVDSKAAHYYAEVQIHNVHMYVSISFSRVCVCVCVCVCVYVCVCRVVLL